MDRIHKKNNRIIRFDFSGISSEKPDEQPTEKKEKKVTPPQERAKNKRLSSREKKFCREYVKTGNATQAYINAGYTAGTRASAGVRAHDLLKNSKVTDEISRLQAPEEDEAIATSHEVMSMLTAIARGEDTDQFGLEISADTRMKALVELAKRTVDLDNRVKLAQQTTDNTLTIKLDWSQDN